MTTEKLLKRNYWKSKTQVANNKMTVNDTCKNVDIDSFKIANKQIDAACTE